MSGLPQIGNWGADLGNSLAQLGGGLGQIINPNQDAQARMKKMLIEDPSLKQKLIDMEAMNPGSVAQMYGKWAANLGQGTMSTDAEMEMAQRGMANRKTSDVTAMGTVASDAKLEKIGVGGALKQKAATQQLDYYDLLQSDIKKKAALNEAILAGQGGYEGVTAATKLEHDSKMRQLKDAEDRVGVAKETLKSYGGNRQELLNDLADYMSGDKPKSGKPAITAEQQFALMDDPQFSKTLDYLVDSRRQRADASMRWSLANFDRASQLDIGARNQANEYMKALRSSGINNLGYKELYNFFRTDADKIEKDPVLKKTGETIASLDDYTSQMARAQLIGNVYKAGQTLNAINQKIVGSKLPKDVKREEIDNAIAQYNLAVEPAIKISMITGKPMDIPTPDIKNIKRMFGDVSVLEWKAPKPATNIDYDSEAAAYKASGGTMAGIDSLSIKPEEKAKLKIAYGKLGVK